MRSWISCRASLTLLFFVQALAFMSGQWLIPLQLLSFVKGKGWVKMAAPPCLSRWEFPSHKLLEQVPGPLHRELAQFDRHWQQENQLCEVPWPQEPPRDIWASGHLISWKQQWEEDFLLEELLWGKKPRATQWLLAQVCRGGVAQVRRGGGGELATCVPEAWVKGPLKKWSQYMGEMGDWRRGIEPWVPGSILWDELPPEERQWKTLELEDCWTAWPLRDGFVSKSW